MSHRAAIAAASLAAVAMTAPTAAAQDGEAAIRSQLRACSQIGDVAARVACYDALSSGGAEAAAAPLLQAAPEPRGLGCEQVRRARTPQAERATMQAEPDSIEATVAAVVQREPGIHLLTLEDGAQWQFVEGVPLSYNPPRRGSKVEIRGASLGSYQMRYQDQAAVRVRRVR